VVIASASSFFKQNFRGVPQELDINCLVWSYSIGVETPDHLKKW
jgi:hypothetical protein